MRANLLRSVSHDIRTPLTSIVGSTSTVLENPSLPRAEQEALLEDVRSEAQWLIRAVENLLSITRMGDGQTHITKNVEAAEEILGGSCPEIPQTFSQHPRICGTPSGAASGTYGRHPYGASSGQPNGECRCPR